jgi:serine/threonine-protein kinase
MATVYLAHDLKHDRQVAIKVLRPELAAVIGAERFLSEIKTTANLQHPHILPLFDSGRTGGQADGRTDDFLFYVMPYIEGESLRDRLNREKQLPIADAVRITTEVASALDYAHRHNVIHRDIKPENILLHDGQALVADFGIALAASKAGGGRMTETGMSLGTPHYMSPEQAMGEREITARSDIYALGCMTYEMLVGDPPFTGSTAQAIVAKVMTEKPAPPSRFRDTVPEAVEEAVLVALSKLPADRWGSAAEFAHALTNDGRGEGGKGGTRRMRSTSPLPYFSTSPLVLGVLLTLAIIALWGWLRPRPPAALARYEIETPGLRLAGLTFSGSSFAIAPDGSRLAYVTSDGVRPTELWIRDRASTQPRNVPGSAGADAPFFSPDGEWLGYFADGHLYKVAAAGGTPALLADSATRSLVGGTWLPDGSVRFIDFNFSLRAPNATQAAARPAVPPPGQYAIVFPAALPRNDAMLATICSNNCAHMAVEAVDLRTGKWKLLVDNAARSWYLEARQILVIARPDGSIQAAHFDPRALELLDTPVPILTGVQVNNGIVPEVAVGASGILAYLPNGGGRDQFAVVRVSRQGKITAVDSAWRSGINSLALSPDGSRLAVSIVGGGRTDVWIKQLDAGPLTRLTFDGSLNYRPAWRTDGRTVSFTSDRAGPSFLYTLRADGSSKPERLMASDTSQVDESQWSVDGRWLVFRIGTADDHRDIYARGTGPDTARIVVSASRFDEYGLALSPDSRWVAYVSVESGREEVYVRPFPNTTDARWQVSTEGGSAPAWAHSGKELFYLTADGHFRAVAVVGGKEFQASSHQDLFSMKALSCSPYHTCYVVSPDDLSFIMLQPWGASRATTGLYLELVLNWTQELNAALGKK